MTIKKEEILIFKKVVELLHDWIILKTGGELGMRDDGGLYHICTRIYEYSEKNMPFFDWVSHIYKDFATRHYFIDGNKRTAHTLAKAALIAHGYHFKIPYKEAVKFIIEIGDSKKSLGDIKKWLEENSERIKEDEINKYITEWQKKIGDEYHET